MQKAIKYIIPFLGILYCIAFFEVEVFEGQHQTYHDEYDSYTASHSQDLVHNLFSLNDFQSGSGNLSYSWTLSEYSFLKTASKPFTQKAVICLSHKLFINNCTWLI